MKQLPDRLRSLIGSFPCSHQPRGTEVSQNPVSGEPRFNQRPVGFTVEAAIVLKE